MVPSKWGSVSMKRASPDNHGSLINFSHSVRIRTRLNRLAVAAAQSCKVSTCLRLYHELPVATRAFQARLFDAVPSSQSHSHAVGSLPVRCLIPWRTTAFKKNYSEAFSSGICVFRHGWAHRHPLRMCVCGSKFSYRSTLHHHV